MRAFPDAEVIIHQDPHGVAEPRARLPKVDPHAERRQKYRSSDRRQPASVTRPSSVSATRAGASLPAPARPSPRNASAIPTGRTM